MAKHMRDVMTWRQIRDQLNTYPDDVLDMVALIWMDPEKKPIDEFVGITELSPYDRNGVASPDNELSFDYEGAWR